MRMLTRTKSDVCHAVVGVVGEVAKQQNKHNTSPLKGDNVPHNADFEPFIT